MSQSANNREHPISTEIDGRLLPGLTWREQGELALLNHNSIPILLQAQYLVKVLRSDTFARSEQLRRLLHWLGERSFVEHPNVPTEQEVAASVLGRVDFDPQTDSLVRKEMSRLREKLSRYYQGEGARDAVQIVTGGGYLLRCQERHPGLTLEPPSRGAQCLLVLPMTADGMSVTEGRKLQEEIQFRLTRDSQLELVSPTTARRYANHPGDVREFASQCGADYVLEGSSWRSEEGFEAVLWVVDGQSGRTSRACRSGSVSVEQLSSALVEQVLGVLSRQWSPDSTMTAIPVGRS